MSVSQKREKRITLRLTEDEYNLLTQLASERGITVSELVRRKLFRQRLPQPSPLKLLSKVKECKRLSYELNRIGNNLNQVARMVNKRKGIDLLTLEALLRIERELGLLAYKVFSVERVDNVD